MAQNDKELAKLEAAMSEDEKLVRNMTDGLINTAKRKIHFNIINRNKPGNYTECVARPWKNSEITEMRQRLEEINHAYVTAGPNDTVVCTADQQKKINALTDEFISRATQIPLDVLRREITEDQDLQAQLFHNILIRSIPSSEQMEALELFRLPTTGPKNRGDLLRTSPSDA